MVGKQVLAFGKSEKSEFIYIGSFGLSGGSHIWGPNIGRSRRGRERSHVCLLLATATPWYPMPYYPLICERCCLRWRKARQISAFHQDMPIETTASRQIEPLCIHCDRFCLVILAVRLEPMQKRYVASSETTILTTWLFRTPNYLACLFK